MAVTSVSYTGNGNTAAFNISFDYQDSSDVKVTVDNTPSTAFTVLGSTLTFNSAPANGAAIRIFRDTYDTNLRAIFQSGSAIRAEDLNKDNTQLLYLTQESNNTASDALTTSETANTTANTANTTANTANATANAANTTANQALNTANASIAITKNVTAYNPFQNVANLPSPSDGYYASVADSTGIENLANLSGLPNGFVGSSDLSVRLVGDGTQWLFIDYYANDPDNRYQQIIADDNAYTDAEKTKLAGIESGATADQSAAEIRTLVDSATDSNVFTDADHSKLNGIEAGATGDQTAAEIRTLVNAASNSNVFTDADHTKLDGIESGATADQTAAEIRTLVGSASNSNVFTDADHTKLNGIESGATADQTKADIDALNIDADRLDGQHGSYYRNAGNLNTGTIPDARLPGTISSDITGSSASCTGNAATATNADQLDGQHGSYYRNAGNLNTGTISDARLPATISSNITGSSASCTGNASTATTATNATNARIDHDTGNAWHRPVFIDDDKATATNQRLKTDNESTIGFNPSENKIRATTFVGTLNGNAVTASTSTNCGRSVISGSGLTGGGTLSQDRTLNVGQGSGINVTADSVHVDSTVLRTTGDQTISNTKTFNGRVNIRGNIDLSDNQYLDFGSSDDVSIHFSSNGWLYYNLKQNGIVFQDNGDDRIILEDSGIIRPSGNNTGTIGTSSSYWDNGYFQDFNISNNLTVSNKINVGSSDNGHAIEVDRSASYSTHLYIGGWSSSNSSNIARIRCSSNLHIDGPSNGSCYINWYATNKNIYLGNTGQNVFAAGTNKVWHAGNDGSGSGLDADTVDGIQGGSFLRSDANDTATGTITFNGVANFRSAIDLADNDILRLGSGDDAELFFNGSHLYLDLNAGNLNIRENTTTRYTLNRNGTLSLVNLQASERVRAGNGTQNNAAFKFNGDDDTGMYRIGSNHMALITGANRRHSIASSGQQIFSAQGAPTRAHIFKTAQGSSTNRYIISGYRSSSRADQADGAEVFRVRTTGGVQNTANQYTSLSDERLKENIVDAQSQWDDVKALRLVNFNFIEDVGFGPEKLLGFIAQEVEEICPQLVDTDDLDDEEAMVPGQKSVKNSIIMTKGFGALQEAMARIEQLEARIAALEAP